MTFWIIVLIALLSAKVFMTQYLNYRDLQNLGRLKKSPEKADAIQWDQPTWNKALAYSTDQARWGRWETLVETVITALILFSPFLPMAMARGSQTFGSSPAGLAITVALTLILISVLSWPMSYLHQFKLEEKHGFNRSNPKLWWTDQIKGIILGLAIGFPLLWALISIVKAAGPSWWIWGAVTLILFQLLMMVLFPLFILPLFNKLTPLPEGDLRNKLEQLAEKTRFSARSIEVMDGSKRSGHSNAFFAGWGKGRKIVLFDTLIEQLNPDEIEAVLAHEVGHFRKKHLLKHLLLNAVMVVAAFAAFDFLIRHTQLFAQLGFNPNQPLEILFAQGIILFSILLGLVSFWLTPLSNHFSRKHEYEADAFAKEHSTHPSAIITALRKLEEKNLSNPFPDPVNSWWYFSHPTVQERAAAFSEKT